MDADIAAFKAVARDQVLVGVIDEGAFLGPAADQIAATSELLA
jgi:hypothetical protein